MKDKSIKRLSGDIAKMADFKPIRWPQPITTGVAKVHLKRPDDFLADVEVPIYYAGTHWVTIAVHGERTIDEDDKEILGDMRCYINGERADNVLPESLLRQIAGEILAGDFD
jgi:hypothetical protein